MTVFVLRRRSQMTLNNRKKKIRLQRVEEADQRAYNYRSLVGEQLTERALSQ